MTIAILINTSWNIYNFRKGLIVQLLSDGHKVVALAPKDSHTEKLEQLGCVFREVEMSATGLNPIKDYKLFKVVKGILRSVKPDVLLTYTIKPNIYGTLAARSLGIPTVSNVSGLGTIFLWKGVKKRVAAELYGYALRKSTWVFFQNEFDRRDFSSTVNIHQEKTSLVPGSGVDISHFSMAPITQNKRPVFLMISRLIIDKGVREFVAAAELVNKKTKVADFVLVGSLDESHSRSIPKMELESWRDSGVISYQESANDVRPLIAASDVVVLPSYREGTPRTLLEGGAMGRPLIATDVPGCNNVLQCGVNGYLCRVRDSDDLAEKMKYFIALSTDDQSLMAERSRQVIADRFDEKYVIQAYLEKIGELKEAM